MSTALLQGLACARIVETQVPTPGNQLKVTCRFYVLGQSALDQVIRSRRAFIGLLGGRRLVCRLLSPDPRGRTEEADEQNCP